MRRPLLLLALLPLAAGPVSAQPRPPTFPTRDVAVTYRVLGNLSPQAPREFTAAALAAGGMLRLESPAYPAWVLADRAGRTDMVVDSLRAVTPAPVRQQEGARLLRMVETARLTRTGTARQAGQPCTTYRWEQENGRGTACVTADGVLLRGVNERGEGIEATGVDYARQDPARFRVPDGYRRMDLGGMARGFGLSLPGR